MKDILFKLLTLKDEKEIEVFLTSDNIFSDRSNWFPLFGIENNKGTIDSQGMNPIKALVEKITNSIDALLIKKCLEKSINPKSNLAPNSIKEGLDKFFNIEDSFIYLSKDVIDKLASQIYLIVENLKNKKGNIYVIDQGEGQNPEDFEKTFLKLGGNKDDIFFTHGRFGIGSFGVLANAGNNGYQIILSKKFNGDAWSWTLIGKFFRKGYKHSRYEYFKPFGSIPIFKENDLSNEIKKILFYEKIDIKEYKSGTLIKLFNYNLHKINDVDRDLNREIDRYLCEPALPYRLLHIREKGEVKGHVGPGKEAKGNLNKLEEWKNQGLVEYYSLETILPYLGKIKARFYLGKRRENNKESIIEENKVNTRETTVFFTFNGQSHHELDRYFLEDDLKLNYIHKDLVIFIDCSHLSPEIFDKFFSPNREQARINSEWEEIKNELIKILKKLTWLKEKDQQRKLETLDEKISSDEKSREIIKEIILKEPYIKKLLTGKWDILDPTKISTKSKSDNFIGKLIPTYIECIDKEIIKKGYKTLSINTYVKVVFKTDAQNDYFDRKYTSGKLIFISTKNLTRLKGSTSPIDGRLTLLIEPKDKNNEKLISETEDIFLEITRPPHPIFNPDNTSLKFSFKIKFVPYEEPKINPGNKKNKSQLENLKIPAYRLVPSEQMNNPEDLCYPEIWEGEAEAEHSLVLKEVLINKDFLPLKNYFLIHNFKEKTKLRFEKIFYNAVWLDAIIVFNQLVRIKKFRKEKFIEIMNNFGEPLIYTLFSLKESYFLQKEND